MSSPARKQLDEVERALAALSGASLDGPVSGAVRRFEEVAGRPPPAGFAAFLGAHDGGRLGPGVRLLSIEDSIHRRAELRATHLQRGLWPVLERDGRRFALDPPDAAAEPGVEWPVVDVSERGIERVATSYLAFLHVLAAELASPDEDPLDLARELCARDPGLGDHWLDLAEQQEKAGNAVAAAEALDTGLGRASPIGPALLFAVGMRSLLGGDETSAHRRFEEAIAAPAFTAREEDARLDAAALVLVRALETGDAVAAARARAVLGQEAAATAAFWRLEALHGMAVGETLRADLALRVVAALVPADPDVARLRGATPAMIEALQTLVAARSELESGRPPEATALARRALADAGELGVAHALLAESLNAARDPDAAAAALRATEQNPLLADGWRELGDARLEVGDARGAEEAFRRVLAIDSSYALGHAKLAQALLEAGRALEALDEIRESAERGGDPFFVAAIRGDIYSEMERHDDAAAAYDQALRVDPEDHRALHQAAVEHGFAGNDGRAAELFEAAIRHDEDGCPQTLFDYADLLRKMGRIGDAVRFYRRAVAAVPGDPEWKQSLREAERELLTAPN